MSTPTDPHSPDSPPQDPQATYEAATVSISTDDARRLMEEAEQAAPADQEPTAEPAAVVEVAAVVEQVPVPEETAGPEPTPWEDASQETVTVDQGAWRAPGAEAAGGAGAPLDPARAAADTTAYSADQVPVAYDAAQSPSFAAPGGTDAPQPDPYAQAGYPQAQQAYTQPDPYAQAGYSQDQQTYPQQAYDQQGYAQAGTQQPGNEYVQGAPQAGFGAPGYGAPGYGAPGYGAPGYAGQPVYGQKSKVAAGILGIFLGSLGIHNFYLGYTGKAVAQLLITVLTFGIGAMVTSIWGLIEGILILTAQPGTPTWGVDAKGVPLAG